MTDRILHFVFPGDINTRTGGYRYDRRIIQSLTESGWIVRPLSLPGNFPFPSATDSSNASALLNDLPDQALTVIDGLAFSAMPDVIQAQSRRLRLIALVHHPLALETGLTKTQADTLVKDEQRALSYVTRVITTSTTTAKTLEEYQVAHQHIRVVPPGTDIGSVASGSGNQTLNLLCVATLIPRKGHTVLLDALSSLTDDDWHLHCVGNSQMDTSTTRQIEAKITEYSLQKRVSLVGELDDEPLSHMYQQADVFVLASLYEGYGMVLDEAIAHGLPIVCTNGGAMGDTVPADAALVVPPDDSPALAQALKHVITDAGLRRQLAHQALVARKELRTWVQAGKEFAQAVHIG